MREREREREVRKYWFNFRPTIQPRKNISCLCLPFLRWFANTGRRIYLNIRLKSRVESLRELLLLFLVLVCRRSGPELVFVKESIHRCAKPVCLSFSNSWKIQIILSNCVHRSTLASFASIVSFILYFLLFIIPRCYIVLSKYIFYVTSSTNNSPRVYNKNS